MRSTRQNEAGKVGARGHNGGNHQKILITGGAGRQHGALGRQHGALALALTVSRLPPAVTEGL